MQLRHGSGVASHPTLLNEYRAPFCCTASSTSHIENSRILAWDIRSPSGDASCSQYLCKNGCV